MATAMAMMMVMVMVKMWQDPPSPPQDGLHTKAPPTHR